MSKHTRGPWLLRDKSDSVHEACATHRFGRQIFRFHGGFDGEDAPSDADVRLILAAPDLLEALANLLNFSGDEERIVLLEGRHISAARAALAKATGSTD